MAFPANPEIKIGIDLIDSAGPAAIDLDRGRRYRTMLQGLADTLIGEQIMPMLEARMKISLVDFNRPRKALCSSTFDVFRPKLPGVSAVLGKEGRGLGAPQTPQATAAQTTRLHDDILALYLDNDVNAWNNLLGDVTVVPFRSTAQAAEVLTILGGNASPLKRFYGAVGEETDCYH